MMTLFELVNTAGLQALSFGGDTIPLNQIDDAMAEKLIGKTHVLKRLAAAAGPTPVVLALAEPAAEPAAAEAEAPAPGRKRPPSN